MWQNIIVAFIGVWVVGQLLYNAYHFFFIKKKGSSASCPGCSSCSPHKMPYNIKKKNETFGDVKSYL